jgi:sugar lactone lactonase YvrE
MKYILLLFILLHHFAIPLQAQLKQSAKRSTALNNIPKTVYQFTTFAGAGYGHLDGPGNTALFRAPEGITVDKNGSLYITEYGSSIIRKITPDGMVITFAGKDKVLGSHDGMAEKATFNHPHGITVDDQLNVYVSDMMNCNVRKITPDGGVETIAGIATVPGSADGIGSTATFNKPEAIAINRKGYLYVADTYNFTIREIAPNGYVTTFAGKTGKAGNADGPRLQAMFNMPVGIAIDSMDNIYVADADYDGTNHGNCTIRKISPQGKVTTLAGLPGLKGAADGKGNRSRFNRPVGITVSKDGVVYVADTEGDIIRRIDTDGTVYTIGGKYMIEDRKDGIGAAARFNDPQAIVVDSKGVLFIADTLNDRISKGESIK